MDYKDKYLKYKMKYFNLKKQYGGNDDNYPLTLSVDPDNDNKTIQIKKIKNIGGGEFGLVFKAELSDDSLKDKYCKHIAFKTLRNKVTLEELTRELEIFNKIQTAKDKNKSDTSNISNSYGGFKLHNSIHILINKSIKDTIIPYCIVMEYCEFGTLKNSNFEINDNQTLLILRDAAKGIDQLHNLNYVHRDIAARNILICYNKSCYKSNNNIIGKITDFGLAREMDNGSYIHTNNDELPVRYLSPYTFENNEIIFNKFTDAWSFGCTIYETLVGNLYKEKQSNQVLQIIKDDKFKFFDHNEVNVDDRKALQNFINNFFNYAKNKSGYSNLYNLFNSNLNMLTRINIEDIRVDNYDETLSNYFEGKNK